MAIRAAAPMARGSLVCSQSHRKLLGFSNNHHHHTFLSLHPPRSSHHNSTGCRPSTTVFIDFETMGPGPSPRRHHFDLLPVTPRAADSNFHLLLLRRQNPHPRRSILARKGFIWSDWPKCWDFAVGYAEVKPVPCLTYSDALQLRETYATPILKQVRNEVTRYRYGDEQHLDEALKRIFQVEEFHGGVHPFCKRFVKNLVLAVVSDMRTRVTEDGKYCLVLVFEAKALELSDFERRQAKFASFFGPGITAEVAKGEQGLNEVRLISDANSNTSPS